MLRSSALVLAALASPAAAGVQAVAPHGFVLRSTAVVAAGPADAYAQITRIGEWWNGAHTYSGNAANMTLEPRAGGCFCERLPADGGSVEHGRVVYAQPGQVLRLSAALGPLQAQGVTGSLTWSLKAVDGGTEIVQTYAVGGHMTPDATTLAPLVDGVMSEQFGRLTERLGR